MSALLTEESRIAELLLVAEAFIRRGSTVAEAAASIGVPVSTLQEWRTLLARAEQRHFAARSKRLREELLVHPAL